MSTQHPRYYRALFSLLDGRFAVVHFSAADDLLAYAHASDCLTTARDWPAGMMLRDVTFVGLDAPRAELGSLMVSGHFGRRTAKG